ncbi:type I restriction-modification system, restriction subunit R [Vibrio sp. JCM 19053]|nr:type I restriction-modification system, restriction subunit R [Vibrio sp. JCM 19053]
MYEIEKGVMIKKLPRYQQWRAVEKTLIRLQGKDPQLLGQELGGVVWHTQGSGKSLTMALLARLMRAEISGFNNPSILILTDALTLTVRSIIPLPMSVLNRLKQIPSLG